MRTLQILPLALVCILVASDVAAQAPAAAPAPDTAAPAVRSHTSKLFLQAHFNGTGLAVEDADAEGGSGFGVKLGYGFNPLFTLYAGFDAAGMRTEGGEYGYGLFDIGGQFNFRSGPNAVVPYLDLALTGQAAVFDIAGDDLVFSGSGFTLGGGLKYFATPAVAIDGSLSTTLGSFREVEYQGDREAVDASANGVRLGFGISWYPVR